LNLLKVNPPGAIGASSALRASIGVLRLLSNTEHRPLSVVGM
jgi:hypothetical protein